MMNWEEPRHPTGRRSRLEIVCDILRVISQGANKPTRIMQLANLTWNDLLMYLTALMREQLVTKGKEGSRASYALTEKGKSMLNLYVKLTTEFEGLALDRLSPERVEEALERSAGRTGSSLALNLEKKLSASGFRIENSKVVGRSGVTHVFDLVATGPDGGRRAYVVLDEASERQVIGLFVKQLDTDLTIFAYSKKRIPSEAKKLAKRYSIKLEEWSQAEEKAPAGGAMREVVALAGRTVLLEVDTSRNYEKIVREFASQFKASGYQVCVFTWKGSPVYDELSGISGVDLYAISTTVSYPKRGARSSEILVPQSDTAVILDELGKALGDKTNSDLLILFDSLSDVAATFGFEKSYEFMKSGIELVGARKVTAVFIIKLGVHADRDLNLIRGLYGTHVSYGAKGLSITREA